jgi:hypothetical protein
VLSDETMGFVATHLIGTGESLESGLAAAGIQPPAEVEATDVLPQVPQLPPYPQMMRDAETKEAAEDVVTLLETTIREIAPAMGADLYDLNARHTALGLVEDPDTKATLTQLFLDADDCQDIYIARYTGKGKK